MRKILLLSMLSAFVVQPVYATHLGSVTIERIRLYNSYALVKTDKEINAPECAVQKGYFKVLLGDDQASNRRLSVLLAAQAQKSIVNPNCIRCDEGELWLGKLTICDEVSIE